MKTRILVAVIGLPLLIAVMLFLPVWAAAVVIGVICALACHELLYATGLVKNPRIVAASALMALFVCLWPVLHLSETGMRLAVFVYIAWLFLELLAAKTKLDFALLCLSAFAGLGVPYLLSAVVRILNMENGRYLVLLPFVMTMVPDSGAYFVGCAIGKHKLAPEISPKKTVEGVVGGVVTGILAMLLYAFILQRLGLTVNYLYAAVCGLLGAVGSVVGDLTFSTIKRQNGIKDFGALLPGHGGALDRFDSTVLVAPLAELLLLLIPFAV